MVFRLPVMLTGDNIRSQRLNVLYAWQPLCYFFQKKSSL